MNRDGEGDGGGWRGWGNRVNRDKDAGSLACHFS